MKKAVLSGVFAAALCSAAQAEMKPYAGLNYNFFSVSGKNRTSVSSTSTTRTSLEDSSDSGDVAGLNLGLYLDETKRINFQYFRGEDNDSSIFTTDMTSLSFDYVFNVFNTASAHSGLFAGAGFSYIRIESSGKQNEGKRVSSKVSNTTNFLFRGGYTHQFENNIMLEFGLNWTLAETEHKFHVVSNTNTTTVSGDFTVASTYLGINYGF